MLSEVVGFLKINNVTGVGIEAKPVMLDGYTAKLLGDLF